MITLQELNYRRGWSLQQKTDHTLGVIDQFYAYTDGKVYVGFSGGKDSTVLLHLIRRVFDRNVLAVFSNTGNEYPDIVRFVRHTENVKTIHPAMTIKQVIDKYGFPLISKEQSKYIHDVRHAKSKSVIRNRLLNERGSAYAISKKWRFLVNAPFEISDRCCEYLKKSRFISLKKSRDLIRSLGRWLLSQCSGKALTFAGEAVTFLRKGKVTAFLFLYGPKMIYGPIFESMMFP